MEKRLSQAHALPTVPTDPKPGSTTSNPPPTGARRRGIGRLVCHHIGALAAALLLADARPANAGTAYGTLNNFDCVNDTGVEAHGFEIELDDIHSTDITYTYDYNHYGTPKITEDNTDPLHPRVFIRYAGQRRPDGTWTAYTAVPTSPIAPTDGHQFTNPSINFGGEHFGAGYYGAPSAVKYNWLIDDGTGSLVHGPPVYVSTPTFTYYPPVVAQQAPQVQAVIVPPPPPAPPVLQFGQATWVKDIKTSTHNNKKVELVDLRDPDPNDPNVKDWANGEPAEVETEWRILQTEFADAGNPKGELKGLPEDLPGGDEVITRRYEFYKYIGPIDAESGEAMADQVGPDGIHGVGTVTYINGFDALGEPIEVTVDLSTIEVVGEFFGAQMSGFDVAPALGLIDHVPDGELNVPYADRRVVIGEEAGFLATLTGNLPDGTSFDPITGIFSGTPTVAGVFSFTIEASDIGGSYVSKSYTVTITDSGAAPVVHVISTSASPFDGGSTTGDGAYEPGTQITAVATTAPGYSFVNWTENGVEVSASANYTFTVSSDRTLLANFAPITYSIGTSASPAIGGSTSGGGLANHGDPVTVVASPNAGYAFLNWSEAGTVVSASASYSFNATANRSLVASFAPITYSIGTSASPAIGGSTSGGGLANHGDPVTVVASPNAGYTFLNWSEAGTVVSASASYSFNATANRSLVASFAPITYSIGTSASPAIGGSTSGGGIVNHGDPVTVVASPNAGYTFLNWSEAGTVVSSSASYNFSATANRSLVANFAQIASSGSIRSLHIDSGITGGSSSIGVIRLSSRAPAGGYTVQLSSSNPAVLRVPVSIYIPGGQKTVTFLVNTSPVAQTTTVLIKAQLGGSTAQEDVHVLKRRARN